MNALTKVEAPANLAQFRILNGALKTFLIEDDNCDPFLKRGQYGVIDTADRALVHDEVFLIQTDYNKRRNRLVHVTKSLAQTTRRGPQREVWWTKAPAGFRRVGSIDGIPAFSGLSDGPFYQKDLAKLIIGKVVGVAFAPLGRLLPRCRGWKDEERGNQRFCPAEYIDALHAAGYKICVLFDQDGVPRSWIEHFPDSVVPDDAEKAVWKAREKLSYASTGKKRLIDELLSRGLHAAGRSAA